MVGVEERGEAPRASSAKREERERRRNREEEGGGGTTTATLRRRRNAKRSVTDWKGQGGNCWGIRAQREREPMQQKFRLCTGCVRSTRTCCTRTGLSLLPPPISPTREKKPFGSKSGRTHMNNISINTEEREPSSSAAAAAQKEEEEEHLRPFAPIV